MGDSAALFLDVEAAVLDADALFYWAPAFLYIFLDQRALFECLRLSSGQFGEGEGLRFDRLCLGICFHIEQLARDLFAAPDWFYGWHVHEPHPSWIHLWWLWILRITLFFGEWIFLIYPSCLLLEYCSKGRLRRTLLFSSGAEGFSADTLVNNVSEMCMNLKKRVSSIFFMRRNQYLQQRAEANVDVVSDGQTVAGR